MKWMQRKIHVSWRIAGACACFVVGVAVSQMLRAPPWLGFAAVPLLVGVLFLRQVWGLTILGALAVGAGISYGSLHLVGRDVYKYVYDTTSAVSGRVKEDISKSASGTYSLQLDGVYIGGVAFPGTILATSRVTVGALRGDTVYFEGRIGEGFASFPAVVSVLSIDRVERQQFGDVGREIRDGFAEKVRAVIPEPQASLGIGFLTGQKSTLPVDLADALKIAGLTHIVVASGYNLTILVRVARKLLLKVSKYLSAVSAGIMILGFMMITGLSPSMTRAGLVSGMSLLSGYYGHAFHPLVLLPIAAAITVAFQPSYVWGDLGWQLSFVAFAGVMIVAPVLHAYFFGAKEPSIMRQLLGETIAAHLVTIPIIALGFGTISNVAIIANLLVVPLVPLAMLLTFGCGIGVLLSVPLIEWVATLTTWVLSYMTNVAYFVADIPWAQSEILTEGWFWLIYVCTLGGACVWMWRKSNYNFRQSQVIV